MASGQSSSLQLPSFLHGTFRSVKQKTRRDGSRCGEQYREERTFPVPRQMLEVSPGEVVVAHEVVDFQRERPAWRLYMVSNVMNGLLDAVDSRNTLSTSPQAFHPSYARMLGMVKDRSLPRSVSPRASSG